jgi:N utilization substance protein A
MVVNELRGEKIDIVPFTEDTQDFVMKALSPAKVKEVRLDEETGTAEVIVPDYQLSLAIGKEGQNARLAARLTGWRVDIKSETQLAEEEAGYAGEEWAEGEWITDEAGQQVWRPAEGGPAVTAEEWSHGDGDAADAGGESSPEAAEAPEAPEVAEVVEVADDAATPPTEVGDEVAEAAAVDEAGSDTSGEGA